MKKACMHERAHVRTHIHRNLMDRLNSRLEMTEKRVSTLKDRPKELSNPRNKKTEKNELSLRDLSENNKRSSIFSLESN